MKLKDGSKYYLAVIVALLTFLVYLPTLRNGFVNWDDNVYVYENPYISSFDFAFIKWAFSHYYAANWHPLTWISHAMDCAMWGLNPLGHHLTNNILHAVNTFIVVIAITELLRAWNKKSKQKGSWDRRFILLTAAATGLLFGIHPLHVESVAWISERKDLLCALFFLLGILMYLKYASGIGRNDLTQNNFKLACLNKYYLLTMLFFVLGILSKPMAVSLPFVLLILDWYPLRRIESKRISLSVFADKLPLVFLSIVSSIITIQAQKGGSALLAMAEIPLSSRVLVAFRALCVYLWKMLMPTDLLPFYPYSKNIYLLSPQYMLPLVIVIFLTVVCVLLARNQKSLLSAWGYYVVTLIPVLGIIQVGTQSMADRYTYLPSLGPFLILGIFVAFLVGKTGEVIQGLAMLKLVKGAIVIAILVMLAFSTIEQIGVWKDSITLWTYIIDNSPEKNALPYNYRSVAFGDMGSFDKAIMDSNEAITLDPLYYDAYVNRGVIFGKAGMLTQALQSLDKAIGLNPSDSAAYVNRGIAYALAGRYDKALGDFNEAIKLNQQNAATFTYLNRGRLYLRMGDKESAVSDFRMACELGVEQACIALNDIQAASASPRVSGPSH